ncbi:ferredoxin--NADP reductase [Parendozoicomonas haliclonae]|uniref:Phenol hydroxylase P5 protein n=1 Tax=Parendozoicomonas haliclonae TaxID=1960125 RepID=A0A1X7AGS7_9GAMM|nr:FAD-binding oxidoreductase [Parendozoicomonas haliclonae]SMA40632.1 Phenol hydroxylase P5 protein [Parendozoicomonas haliclonae]
MPRPTYSMELVSKEQLAPATIGLTFQVTNPPAFEAGQFVSIHFTFEGEELKRSYSIASSPEQLTEDGTLEIAVGLVADGKASQFFEQAEVGQTVEMSGPFGVLTLPEQLPSRLILVGTGTGVAPYRAMQPQLEALAQQGQNIHILMGARTRNDLFYQADFQQMADLQTVTYEACLSREDSVDKQAGEYAGYVQKRLSELPLTPGNDLIFLCGNPNMIDDCVTQLTEAGFGPRQVKREKYTFSR